MDFRIAGAANAKICIRFLQFTHKLDGIVVIPAASVRPFQVGRNVAAKRHDVAKPCLADIGDLLPNGSDIAQRDMVMELIRRVQPDFIITHSPTDYMPDHREVSKLVFDASFAASVPQYGTGGKAAVTPIYYMDNLAGMNFNPTEYVDITDEIDLKLEMLECHISQLKWMRDHDGIDFAEFVKTCSRFRGLQSGVQYAEAFCQEMVWPKVVTRRLLP